VESQNGLGIYIGKSRATVVCIQKNKAVDSFSVTADAADSADLKALMHQVAKACVARKWKYAEVSVALDSALFMQHPVHSEFSNPKQINATVRFDTEEVVATDIANLAVAFQVIKTDDNGSHLNVYTAQHGPLSDIVQTLQSHGMDPVHIMPDVSCLTRMIEQNLDSRVPPGTDALFALVSENSGYFLRYSESLGVRPVRAFLVRSQQNKTDLLAREAFTTMASDGATRIGQMFVFDAADEVDTEALAKKSGVPVSGMEWFSASPWGQAARDSDADAVHCAIAYGAACPGGPRTWTLNFRNDFMPYQGGRLRMQSALKWVCISVTLLLLAVGGRLQATWFQARADREALREKLSDDYFAVMPGRKMPSNPVRALDKEIREIKALKSGQISLNSNQSTLAKLTLILKAVNQSYRKTGLAVDSISIGRSAIKITGSTSNTSGRLQFREALKQVGFRPVENFSEPKGGRAPFSITINTETSARD